jgi:hypothetical protein
VGFGLWGFQAQGLRVRVESFAFGVLGLGSGFRIRVQDVGCRVQGVGLTILGFTVNGSGFKESGSGFRIEGVRFRVGVQELGLGV